MHNKKINQIIQIAKLQTENRKKNHLQIKTKKKSKLTAPCDYPSSFSLSKSHADRRLFICVFNDSSVSSMQSYLQSNNLRVSTIWNDWVYLNINIILNKFHLINFLLFLYKSDFVPEFWAKFLQWVFLIFSLKNVFVWIFFAKT